jgi:FAD binding domain
LYDAGRGVALRPVVDAIETDVLILGAGGLCAALHAADRSPSLSVAVVVKGLLGRAGCTRMVQGGYNDVLIEPDSLDAHFLDTPPDRHQRAGPDGEPGRALPERLPRAVGRAALHRARPVARRRDRGVDRAGRADAARPRPERGVSRR